MKQRGWFQTEVVSHFRALSNNTDSRCPCCLDPHISATPSGITPTLVFNSHVPFFFFEYANHADSIYCIFSNQLFLSISQKSFLWFTSSILTIATEKLYFPESNKLTLSTSSKKYHTPDQLSQRMISALSLET